VIGEAQPFGKGFIGLTRYLEKGHAGEERDRVAWVETRNLPTEDPETAARLMAAWARESVRTQRPVYHLVISADPGDPADRRSLSRVADAVLRELDLSEHQVLIIAHNDTAHPHMHLVVNRVHPETHRAWENSFDWPKIEKALRAEEVALGWRVVPGKHAPVPGQEPAPELERGDAPFLRIVQERGGPVLGRASTWAELEKDLEAVGLHLRIKGGGFTIHDGRQEVKASDVDRLFSRRYMEERLGKLSEYRRTRPAAPSVRPARESEPPAPAPDPREPDPPVLASKAVRQPEEVRPAPAPQVAPAPAPVTPQPRATPAPEPPASAPPPPKPLGQHRAAPEPRVSPPAPPEPRTTPAPARPRERGRVSRPAAAAAPPSPEERFRAHVNAEIERRHEIFPELVGAAELVYESRAWFAYEPQFNAALQAAADAEGEVQRLESQRSDADRAAAALHERLARVYADPEFAALNLMDYQRKHGKERARDALRTRPQEFGTLRKVYPWWGLGIVYSTAAARDEARDRVADPLEKAVRSEEARPGAAAVRDAKERAREARRRLADAREKRRALTSPQTVEQEAAALLAPLARDYGVDWVRRELTRLIPPEDREAVEIAARVVSRAAHGLLDRGRDRSRGRERDRGIDFF
jgi:hypothetical protein